MNFDFLGFKPLAYNGNKPNLKGSDYMGVPTLTSLAFQYNNIRIQFEECIVTVNQEKNIVTTPMQGRDGTVKEYISDGDYTISMDAAVCSYIINQNDATDYQTSQAYPISELEDVISMFKIKDALEVQSDFMMLFGIKNIVIKSYGMVQETHSNRQAFTLQMLSDTPYEIKIKQDASINK